MITTGFDQYVLLSIGERHLHQLVNGRHILFMNVYDLVSFQGLRGWTNSYTYILDGDNHILTFLE